MSKLASRVAHELEQFGVSLSLWLGEINTLRCFSQHSLIVNVILWPFRGEANVDRKNIGGWTPLMYFLNHLKDDEWKQDTPELNFESHSKGSEY
uniref:Uncharacterized protein n=1 Tax=Oncorhynchus mykiss TaxID=8022 RepID=A0A8C7QR38_ONCMY